MFRRFFYDITLMQEENTEDGLGGHEVTLKQLNTFKGAICMSSPKIIIINGKEEQFPVFKVITDKSIILEEGTIIKDLESNKLFIVEQDNRLKATPKGANLDIRVAIARYYLQS